MSIVPTNINNYLRQFAYQLEERILQQFPPLHRPDEPMPVELARLRRTPLPRAGSRYSRNFETLGGREVSRRNRRMRYGKNADLSRGNVRSLGREALHRLGDGAASTHFEVVPGNAPDPAPGTRVSDRWRPQRRGIKRTHGSKRGPASQRTDRT